MLNIAQTQRIRHFLVFILQVCYYFNTQINAYIYICMKVSWKVNRLTKIISSTADMISAMKFSTHPLYIYIYIYIYMSVFVCVSECTHIKWPSTGVWALEDQVKNSIYDECKYNS